MLDTDEWAKELSEITGYPAERIKLVYEWAMSETGNIFKDYTVRAMVTFAADKEGVFA